LANVDATPSGTQQIRHPRISQNWSTIVQRGSNAFAFVLHAATDPFQVLEAIAEVFISDIRD
jgi:hypothetical protein